MEHLLVRGWLLVIVGAAVIGVGGVLTTLGWNKLSSRSQMMNLLMAIAHEWEINNTLLYMEPLFNSDDDAILMSRCLYPRFKRSAMNNALTSGLFHPSVDDAKRFLRTIADYETVVADVNARLDVSDNLATTSENVVKIGEHRRHLQTSRGFTDFKKQHQKLYELLKTNYPLALKDAFLDG
jgi:hypothetical protein